jgi:hypothetical protein
VAPCSGCARPRESSRWRDATPVASIGRAGGRFDVGDPTYRTVKRILAAGTEKEGAPTPCAPDVPADLHGPLTLFDGLDGEGEEVG